MTSTLEQRLPASADAFRAWRRTTPAHRAALLHHLGDLVTERTTELAHLITSEVSKTLRGSTTEVAKCAAYCHWLAEHAERILAPQHLGGGASLSHHPLGVILGIMPWNFPLWQVFRFATAALAAGNVVVVKHSPLVPRCAEMLERLFAEAGFEEGVFACQAASAEEAQRLIADERVRGVSFTGGSGAGRAVASSAGAHLKKCVLELGGSDAFLVMPTADLDRAVAIAVNSRLRAGGQACTAAKRFLVHDAVADDFESRLVRAMQALVIGDPLDPKTDVAPLVDVSFADRLERQVRDSIAEGAVLLCGGRRLAERVYEPTVLSVADTGVTVMQEETFGPVAPVLRVRDLAAAIEAANATEYGLSASVWTADESEIAAFREALDVGQLYVNEPVSSRFDLPFGGTKHSGFGRELGDAGVLEFVNVKAEVRTPS